MRKQIQWMIVLFGLLFLVMGTLKPANSQAQLPYWLSDPWGINLGIGYPRGYGIDVFTYYSSFNTAASFSPLVPFTPYPVVPPVPYFPSYVPPAPAIRGAAATVTLVLPTASLVPSTVPVAPAPIISTTQLFLGLLLTIGEESGLFATNPALFWYIVGILY